MSDKNKSHDGKKAVKPPKQNQRKIAINELIYGLLCILTTSVFALLPITLFALSGGITFNIKNGYIFLLFAFICSLGAGAVLYYHQYLKRTRDSRIIYNAAEKLLRGDYEISFDELSGEYKKIADALIIASQRLKQSEREKNDFMNDFSHELKTPIVSIRGFAKLISKGKLTPEEEKEYLDIIVSESDRLIDLTASTLLLDRLGSNKLEIVKRHFNLSEQIRKIILLLQDEWEKKGIEFDGEIGDYFVYSNEELTSQLFLNILQNAIKYSFNDGKIDINLTTSDKRLTVSIKDYGEGMTEDTLKRMFDKYFRADKSRSTHGNGLGLATVKRIAELLSLELRVTSAPQKGTDFTVIFKDFSR